MRKEWAGRRAARAQHPDSALATACSEGAQIKNKGGERAPRTQYYRPGDVKRGVLRKMVPLLKPQGERAGPRRPRRAGGAGMLTEKAGAAILPELHPTAYSQGCVCPSGSDTILRVT